MGKTYISPSGLAKEVQKIYYGNENNLAQEISKVYIGDSNGVARLVFGNSAILPREYQQVEYIYNTVTGPYINTGLTFTSAIKMYAKIQFPELSTGNTLYYNGTEDTSSRQHLFGQSSQTSGLKRLRVYMATGRSTTSGTTYGNLSLYITANTNIHEYIMDGPQKTVWIDSNSETVASSSTWVRSSSYTFALFGFNHGSSISYAKERIYNFKWYSNGTLTHNYYPCYRKSDNVVGFYDLVANVFKTNQGSGSLYAGPNYIGEL